MLRGGMTTNLLQNFLESGKKSRILYHSQSSGWLRPPNAFILYRQHYHPKVMAQCPDMHNNDISTLLGNQWRGEDEAIRAEWKAKAAEVNRLGSVQKKSMREVFWDVQSQSKPPSCDIASLSRLIRAVHLKLEILAWKQLLMAENAEADHSKAHPDYQYQPRIVSTSQAVGEEEALDQSQGCCCNGQNVD
ncbi:MAG: hypothetical protein M1820_008166 [Bogoriella megaspora]|nr:MAG: hypothetical protein M1820_008166 [Bogoriella megaspora]